jgi:hypothetical protein
MKELHQIVQESVSAHEQEIEQLKKSIGEIPANTCPNIDKALKEIEGLEKDISYYSRNADRYETAKELADDLPNMGWLDTPSILEDLRRDNDKLRELGFNEEYYLVKKKIRCEDCLFKN